MSIEKRVRILLTKAGPDTHTRGISILMQRLRDAGVEVIYTGLFQTAETIVASAIQEDVDFIFLSSHLGGHMALSQRIIELLKQKGAEDIALVVGGMIPQRDFFALKALGVKEAFLPHTLASTVIDFVNAQRGVTAAKESSA
jgi:methylmalonyl-CoA mutase C-terminal domain/subunit